MTQIDLLMLTTEVLVSKLREAKKSAPMPGDTAAWAETCIEIGHVR